MWNKKIFTFVIAITITCFTANAQIDKIIGSWYTIDDATNEVKSEVRIYKATNGKYYGKIEVVLMKGWEDAVCSECEGELHNKKMAGMVIVTNMEYIDGELRNGKVLDPENGKIYYAKIKYDAKKDLLILRGSLDKRGLFGRNQTWKRCTK